MCSPYSFTTTHHGPVSRENIKIGFVMPLYDPLQKVLALSRATAVKLTFPEIEALIGCSLPQSAYDLDAWWSNEDPATTRHSQNRAWKLAGFDAEPNRGGRTVTFRRTKSKAGA
jgi:hypothetical protein